jgi:hypothetical protein
MIEYKTSFGKIFSNNKLEKGDVIRIKTEIGSDVFFYIESIKGNYLELHEYDMIDVEVA